MSTKRLYGTAHKPQRLWLKPYADSLTELGGGDMFWHKKKQAEQDKKLETLKQDNRDKIKELTRLSEEISKRLIQETNNG